MKNFSQNKIILGILSFILLIHLGFINNGFTWLDHGDIEAKRAILPFDRLEQAFVTRYGDTGYYRPLVTIIHSINYNLYGNWALPYHLTNILLHLAVSFVAFAFLHKFFVLKQIQKYLIILIVGIHSTNWFTVGTISNLQELLVVLFTMLALIFHVQTRTKKRITYFFLTILSTVLALLSKETALFWIPALIIFWEITRQNSTKLNKNYLFLSELLVIFAYLVLHLKYIPEVWKTQVVKLSLSESIGTRIAALGYLLFKLINPFKPAASDATKIVGLTNPPVILIAGLIFLTFLLLIKFGLRSNGGKAIALLVILVMPAANLVPLPRFSSSHYAYFPTVAIAIMVILLLQTISKVSNFAKQISWFMLAGWMILMSGITFLSGFRFKNDFTLFAPEVSRDPNYKEGHFYLGYYYFSNSQLSPAHKEYEAALAVTPQFLAFVDRQAANINFAGVLMEENRLEEAESILMEATKQSASNQTAIYNLALLYLKKKDYQKVIDLLDTDKHQWQKPEIPFLLAEALYRLNHKEEALIILRQTKTLLDKWQQQQLELFIQNLELGKVIN